MYRPHVKDHGTCDVSVSDVSLDVSVKVGVDTKGHGTLSTDGCSFNIGHLSVKFHGGARFVTLKNTYIQIHSVIKYNVSFIAGSTTCLTTLSQAR